MPARKNTASTKGPKALSDLVNGIMDEALKASAPETPAEPETPAVAVAVEDKPKRVNLTARVRNQITEMHDEGKSVKEIALATGISAERVQAKLDEAAAAAPKAAADKPKKVQEFTRLPGAENTEGRVTGMALFTVSEDGGFGAYLGTFGANNVTEQAVKAYLASGGAKLPAYISVPARFVWKYTAKS